MDIDKANTLVKQWKKDSDAAAIKLAEKNKRDEQAKEDQEREHKAFDKNPYKDNPDAYKSAGVINAGQPDVMYSEQKKALDDAKAANPDLGKPAKAIPTQADHGGMPRQKSDVSKSQKAQALQIFINSLPSGLSKEEKQKRVEEYARKLGVE